MSQAPIPPAPADPSRPATPAATVTKPGGPGRPPPKSIMRSLGEFFGHIAHAVRTDPNRPGSDPSAEPAGTRQVVRRTVEEEQRDTPRGQVTLRRTVIEEVELPPGQGPGDQDGAAPNAGPGSSG